MYVVGNLGAIGNERIDAVTLTDRQIISQRTPIGANRSWSQAQLNLELEPCRRDRMPITAGQRSVASELSTRRRLSTEFTERVFSPALPLSQRPLRLRLLPPHSSKVSIPHNLETGLGRAETGKVGISQTDQSGHWDETPCWYRTRVVYGTVNVASVHMTKKLAAMVVFTRSETGATAIPCRDLD